MSVGSEDGADVPDPQLLALLSDVKAAVDEDLRVDGGCPDLAAVVALAHRLDPGAVPQSAVDEVAAWAPVVTLREGRRRRATRDDPELSAFLADVRAQVEQDVVDRFAVGDEAAGPAVAIDAPIAARRVWIGVLAAAAALVLVAGGIVTGVLVSRQALQTLPQSAVHQDLPADGEHSTIREADRTRSPRAAIEPIESEPQVQPDAVEPPAAVVPLPETTPRRKRSNARRDEAGAAAPSTGTDPSLDELDRRAHAAWRAGELAQAEAAFRTIIERAGRSGGGRRLADLAYGDLFTLARQSGKPGREAALWREYVRAFPGGRFADDARAGLCRRADGDDRRACWAAYLDAMPEGSHRAQANRELGEE